MKAELNVTAPDGLKENFPGQFEVGRWLDNIILFPMQVFIVTTKKKNGLNNAQLNSWGITAGPGSSPYFIFQDVDHSDTHALVKENGEFTINLCPRQIKDKALKTTEHYGDDTDEVIASGLTPISGLRTDVCRIEECVAHYECRLEWIKELGKGHVLVCGRIVSASVEQELLSGDLQQILSASDILFYLKSPIGCSEGWNVSEHYYYGTMSAEIFE